MDNIHVCIMRAEPNKADFQECWEVVWSGGKSCHACPVTCYRQGWSVRAVLADNFKLVRRKQAMLRKQEQEAHKKKPTRTYRRKPDSEDDWQ
jgi:hypothetical protein